MRTTLTLEPDVAALLAQEAHRLKQPFKQVVNNALRRGLTGAARTDKLPRFRVKPHSSPLANGVDPASFNRLVDEMEDEAVLAKMRRR